MIGPGVDADLTVGDAEEPVLTPARAPAVLADPAAQRVVVADDADAMAAGLGSADVSVDAASVTEEVVIDDKAGPDRSSGGEDGLDLRGGDAAEPGDLEGAALPVRAGSSNSR